MKISVIFPTYNRAHILPMCIDSLINQNYPKSKYEVIVVDNNSTDNTKDVVHHYKNKYHETSIKYILEKMPGSGFARNTGAKNAKFEVLSFTDDDGILCKNWLTEISKVFQKNSKVAAVAGKVVIKWDKKPPNWVKPYEWLLGALNYDEKIKYKKGLYINLGNLSIKKDVLFKLGGFNVDQIGDRLIGNGEDELNERLWGANYLIGWAPKAVMEHYQIVDKNATVKDIKRRYSNLGIATPYRLFAVQKKGCFSLLINLIKRTKAIIKNQIKWFYHFLKGNHEKKLFAIFQISYNYSQIPYTFNIFFNNKFRKYLLNEEWKLK